MPCPSFSALSPTLLSPTLLRLTALTICLPLLGCEPETAPPTRISTQTTTQPANKPATSSSSSTSNSSSASSRDNANLLPGNPSRAGKTANNLLLERPQHALSYNAAKGQANWVAWHLERCAVARSSAFIHSSSLVAAATNSGNVSSVGLASSISAGGPSSGTTSMCRGASVSEGNKSPSHARSMVCRRLESWLMRSILIALIRVGSSSALCSTYRA